MRDRLFTIAAYIKHRLRASNGGHGIHSPFAYRLCEEVFYSKEHFYDFEWLATVRQELLLNQTRIRVQDLGAPSRTFKGKERNIAEIAAKGISSQKQSEILYKLINYLGCKTCIELGTSIGLNTLYLAAALPKGKVYSLEGNVDLIAFAKDLASTHGGNNIEFIEGNFDTSLPELLTRIKNVDCAYLDGNHTYEATIKYFEFLLPLLNNDSVVILDDIYWSREMSGAWESIKAYPRVTLSLDLFHFGLIFFRSEIKEKTSLELYIHHLK